MPDNGFASSVHPRNEMLEPKQKRSSVQLLIAILTPILISSCAFSQPAPPAENTNYRAEETSNSMDTTTEAAKYLELGIWGANGIVVTVQETSVSIDLPCANANFTLRPKLNKKGEFDAVGRYNQEGPGALAIDPGKPEPSPRKDTGATHNARFHGKVTGKKLELMITLIESNEKLKYSLEHGRSVRIFKCM